MKYVNASLADNESIVGGKIYQTRWAYLFPIVLAVPFGVIGLLTLLAGLLVGPTEVEGSASIFGSGVSLLLLAGWIMGVTWLKRWTTEYACTTKRIISKKGLIWRKTKELRLQKVESVAVTQNPFARIFNYGNLHFTGTGDRKITLRLVVRPIEWKKTCESTIESVQQGGKAPESVPQVEKAPESVPQVEKAPESEQVEET